MGGETEGEWNVFAIPRSQQPIRENDRHGTMAVKGKKEHKHLSLGELDKLPRFSTIRLLPPPFHGPGAAPSLPDSFWSFVLSLALSLSCPLSLLSTG